eukprot:g978.t1
MFKRLNFSFLRNSERRFSTSRRPCTLHRLDVVPYLDALSLQRRLMQERFRHNGSLSDVILMVEHPAVYTLGRGAKDSNIIDSMDIPIHRVERGGEVTYHGPGQLVLYPVFDLRLSPHVQDLRIYLRNIEEVVIRVLAEYGLEGIRDEEYTGVWIKNRKICAIGINASRWVTMHGLAFNITTASLPGFDGIIPCGIDEENRGVACLQQYVDVLPEDVEEKMAKHFASVFSLDLTKTNEYPTLLK